VNVVGGIHPVCTQDLKYLNKQSAEMTESLQNDLSPKDWTIMFHLVTHMEEQLRRWGPVKDTWMFGFESFFGDMMSLIKSRSHPVASIMRQDRATQTLNAAKEMMQTRQTPGEGAYSHYLLLYWILRRYRRFPCRFLVRFPTAHPNSSLPSVSGRYRRLYTTGRRAFARRVYRGVINRPTAVGEEVRAVGKNYKTMLTYSERTMVETWMGNCDVLADFRTNLWEPKCNALRRQLYRGYELPSTCAIRILSLV